MRVFNNLRYKHVGAGNRLFGARNENGPVLGAWGNVLVGRDLDIGARARLQRANGFPTLPNDDAGELCRDTDPLAKVTGARDAIVERRVRPRVRTVRRPWALDDFVDQLSRSFCGGSRTDYGKQLVFTAHSIIMDLNGGARSLLKGFDDAPLAANDSTNGLELDPYLLCGSLSNDSGRGDHGWDNRVVGVVRHERYGMGLSVRSWGEAHVAKGRDKAAHGVVLRGVVVERFVLRGGFFIVGRGGGVIARGLRLGGGTRAERIVLARLRLRRSGVGRGGHGGSIGSAVAARVRVAGPLQRVIFAVLLWDSCPEWGFGLGQHGSCPRRGEI